MREEGILLSLDVIRGNVSTPTGLLEDKITGLLEDLLSGLVQDTLTGLLHWFLDSELRMYQKTQSEN